MPRLEFSRPGSIVQANMFVENIARRCAYKYISYLSIRKSNLIYHHQCHAMPIGNFHVRVDIDPFRVVITAQLVPVANGRALEHRNDAVETLQLVKGKITPSEQSRIFFLVQSDHLCIAWPGIQDVFLTLWAP